MSRIDEIRSFHSRFDFEAAELLEHNEAARLNFVRSRAEKWVGGLSALTGLIGAVLIAKAPQSIRAISTPARIVVAVLLALALVALILGTYRAYQSAYGDPGRLDELSRQPLTGLAERLTAARLQAANAAQDHLRQATAATFVALVLLAAATGISWFAPTSTASPSVCLLRNGEPLAELAGNAVSVKRIRTGISIGPCR